MQRLVLGDAGWVVVDVDPDGALLAELQIAAGWRVTRRLPRGRLRRRRRSDAVAVVLEGGAAEDGRRWEAEVSQRDDGVWEAAINEGWSVPDRTVVVDTPGGRVATVTAGAGVRIGERHDRPGWQGEVLEDGAEVVVVVFRRDREEWEVVIDTDPDGSPTGIEREHRWLLDVPVVG